MVDENRRPSFTIVMLAWPVFVEQILVSLVSYVDTAMVGSMGANATAAVSISNSPNMLVNGTIMAIGVGFTAMISRAIGAEDLQRAKDLMRQALLVVVSLGLPLMGALLLLAKKIPLWMGAQPEILPDAAIYNRIIAASLIAEFCIGVLMKAVPTIHVFVLNIQIKMLVGFIVLAASAPVVAEFMEDITGIMFENLNGLVQGFV